MNQLKNSMAVKMACVGSHLSDFDLKLYVETCDYLNMIPDSIDHIDLRNGRDFLQEDKKYDIVVLMFIFAFVQEIHWDLDTKTSLKHSKENWCKRLIDTGAKHIIAHGSDLGYGTEIDGEWLGELEGYKKTRKEVKGGLIYHYESLHLD